MLNWLTKNKWKLQQLPDLRFRPRQSLFKGLVELGIDGLSRKPWQRDCDVTIVGDVTMGGVYICSVGNACLW